MKLFRSFVVLTALLGLGFLCPVQGQGSLTPPGAPAPTMKSLDQTEPRTAISSLPYAITNSGSYYFTANLSGNIGIAINTGNVCLDLNGFTLQGVGATGNGIYINGAFTNITIRNGGVDGWSTGIDGYTYAPRNTLYENLTVSANSNDGLATYNDSIVRNCRAYGNGQVGINCRGQVVDCISRGNGTTGIFGFNALIRNCLSETNGTGIACNVGSVLDCVSVNNSTYGITLQGGASARRCQVQGNNNSGIYTYNFSPLLGGVIADCVIATNTYGISLNGPGYLVTGNELSYNKFASILIQSSYNRIDGNHIAAFAGNYGIELVNSFCTNNVIVRNSVFGGGTTAANYDITVVANDVGPIGSASTNTSPWANISH